MNILSRDSLQQGGFAGLREHRIVTDSRAFGPHKNPLASEGLGSFIYLADANLNPKGETGMHPHKEVDVISVMIKGRVSHAGSLEHGKTLEEGDVQVQRAGGEGFSHNEINPDDVKNRMIQLWALPDESGQRAGYKYYSPNQGVTRIYGGTKNQSQTFDNQTAIDIVKLKAEDRITITGDQLSYVIDGHVQFREKTETKNAVDGDLVRSQNADLHAFTDVTIIVIRAAN